MYADKVIILVADGAVTSETTQKYLLLYKGSFTPVDTRSLHSIFCMCKNSRRIIAVRNAFSNLLFNILEGKLNKRIEVVVLVVECNLFIIYF